MSLNLSAIPSIPTGVAFTGIVVQLVPGNPFYGVQLQMAPDSGGSPGTYSDLHYWPGGAYAHEGIVHPEPLPIDDAYRWFRARHKEKGFTDGNWTTAIKSKPMLVKKISPPLAQQYLSLNAQGLLTKTGTPAPVTKTLRLGAGMFLPVSDVQTWTNTQGILTTNITAASRFFEGWFLLPQGSTIIKTRLRAYRQTTSDIAICQLRRCTDTGGLTGIVTLTHDTTGWQTKESSTLSEVVGAEHYITTLELKAASAEPDARFLYYEVDYTVSDLLTSV